MYHKFPSNDSEKKFLEIVRKFEDMFMDKRDYFIEHNTTHPTHPVRIKKSQKAEIDKKNSVIAKMDELGIIGYDSTRTSEELINYMKSELDRIISENTKRVEKKSSDEKNEQSDIDIKTDDINDIVNIDDINNSNQEESSEEIV